MNTDAQNKKWLAAGYRFVEGMDPICFKDSKILILGSLPGQTSLSKQKYYANNGNNFWPLMADIFKTSPLNTDDSRMAFLKKQKIALWDVYKSGYRRGSRDGIKDGIPNDLEAFLKEHPSINKVIIAGKDAKKGFETLHLDIQNIYFVTSTSGGNGHWNKQKHEWYEIGFDKEI